MEETVTELMVRLEAATKHTSVRPRLIIKHPRLIHLFTPRFKRGVLAECAPPNRHPSLVMLHELE